MKIHIDTLAYTNRLRWLPPEQKLLFATTLLLISTVAHPLVQVLIAAWISIWIVLYAGIPIKTYLNLVYFAALFWLTSFPALAINGVDIAHIHIVQQSDSIFGVTFGSYYLYISHRGIQQGLTILSRSLASGSCLYFIMLTIPFTELLHIFRRIGVPVLVTELLLLMYRFIFVLLNTATELWIAQHARGGYRTFSVGMKSLALLIGQLLNRTIQHYRQVSLSLAARGFSEELRVWHPHRYHQSKRFITEAIFGCALLVSLEWGYYAGMVTRI